MKSIRSNREIGVSYLGVVIAIATAALIVIILTSVYFSDGKVISRKHQALIISIEKRSQKKLKAVMSENYSDRWGFTKEQASLAWREAGSQFLVLVVSSEEPQFDFNDDVATVTVNLKVGGKAIGPIGQEIVRRANSLETPWVFTWKKEGFGPGGWKLIQMENKSIPDDAYGYTPGMIQNALESGDF